METGNDGRNDSGSNSQGKDQSRAGGGAGAARAAIGALSRVALGTARRLRAAWERLRPAAVCAGCSFAAAGGRLLCPPFIGAAVSFIDNLFNAVSAVTTTGLGRPAPASYTFAGELLVLVLINSARPGV